MTKTKKFTDNYLRDIIDKTSCYIAEGNLEHLQIEQFYTNTLVKVNSANIREILKIKNPFLSFYLLINCENESLEFEEKDVNDICRVLSKIETVLDIRVMSDKFLDICLNKMKGISIKGLIRIFSLLRPSKEDIDLIRKQFGYNMIYKTYKNIVEDIYIEKYTVKELGLVIQLLDNDKLCFSRTLDTFNRLSEYLNKQIVDKNLISCCSILISILKYTPKMMTDKKEFLNGMLSYLINILLDRSNFTIYDQIDTDIILETIEVLCGVDCVQQTSYDFKIGLVRQCLFNIDLFLESHSSIYEEVMSFIAILRALGIFLYLCHNTKLPESQADDRFKIIVLENKKDTKGKQVAVESTCFVEKIGGLFTLDFINNLEKYKIPENVCLGYKDNELAKIRFISSKYCTLNNISKVCKMTLSRVVFYNDVYSQNKPKFIFDNLNELKSQVSWSDLIILATHSDSKLDFIPILMHPFYIQNLEHLSYIFLFVFSLKDDYDSILYLTVKMTELNTFDDVDKYWEIFIYIYIHYIDVNDERMNKSRNYIIKKCLGSPSKVEKILEIVIRDCEKDKISINRNLYPILFYLIFNLPKINNDLFSASYKYIACEPENCIKSHKKKKVTVHKDLESLDLKEKNCIILRTQKYTKTDKLYKRLTSKTMKVALLIHLMNIHKPSEKEIQAIYSFNSFFHCIAVGIYSKMSDGSLDFLKRCLFDFVLNCDSKQRSYIKMILQNYKKSKYYTSFKTLRAMAKYTTKE